MTHRRTTLRNAFVSRLTNATAVGSRVFAGRLMPIEEPELPAIVVHTREPEEITERSINGWNGFERRRCIVSVVVVAQSFEDLDEDLDTIAAQVEATLQSWTIPGFESSDPFLVNSDASDPEFDGALTTGSLRLRYAVSYTTPYRDCSNPYVTAGGSLEQSGAYPGGQVTPGCPASNTGEVCPIGGAQLFVDGAPIN